MLGWVYPDYFPHIFGPNENEPLNKDKTIDAFKALIRDTGLQDESSIFEVSYGFIKVANETMAWAIWSLT